ILAQPWELRRGLGRSFGYNRTERAESLLHGAGIVALLTEVVAKGGHLLLSIGPDPSGRIPDLLAAPLREAGAWIATHADLIGRARPWHTWGDDTCRYLLLDGRLHAVDTIGAGRFAALGRDAGTVTAVVTGSGAPVDFDQHDAGLQLARRHRGTGRMPAVYRIALAAAAEAPIELFSPAEPEPAELAPLLAGATRGDVVRLGAGRYVGPVTVPPGV